MKEYIEVQKGYTGVRNVPSKIQYTETIKIKTF